MGEDDLEALMEEAIREHCVVLPFVELCDGKVANQNPCIIRRLVADTGLDVANAHI